MTSLANLSLREARDGFANGNFTAVELVHAVLAKIDALQPVLNAFISVRADDAIASAEGIDALRRKGEATGPIAGVPLAHKDMFFRKGRVSTCGSKILRGRRADTTATVLGRLDATGALDLGTLNMSEFALGPTGANAHFGPVRNPHDTDRISGGSSSGSGAAVGALMAFGALGSDTAGSVRIPASLCGLVGLKPTLGRVSTYGAMPLSQSLDTVGVMARSVDDCALIFDAISGHDPLDPGSSRVPQASCATTVSHENLSGLKVGRPLEHYFDGLHDDVAAVMETAITRLAELGCEVVDLPMAHHESIADDANVIITSEAAALHAHWLATRPEDYGRPVRERIETGFTHSAPDYLKVLSGRKARVAAFADDMRAHCDVFVAPVLDCPAPTIAETDSAGGPKSLELVGQLNRKTRTVNYLGFPAIAVPAGLDSNGMPVGIQVIGQPFAEPLLFRIAAAFESAGTK